MLQGQKERWTTLQRLDSNKFYFIPRGAKGSSCQEIVTGWLWFPEYETYRGGRAKIEDKEVKLCSQNIA